MNMLRRRFEGSGDRCNRVFRDEAVEARPSPKPSGSPSELLSGFLPTFGVSEPAPCCTACWVRLGPAAAFPPEPSTCSGPFGTERRDQRRAAASVLLGEVRPPAPVRPNSRSLRRALIFVPCPMNLAA